MTTTNDEGIALYEKWAKMWNGDLDLAADLLVAEGFILHLTDVGMQAGDPQIVRGASVPEFQAMVVRVRNRYDTLVYRTQSGPFVDQDRGVVCAPWQAEASQGSNSITIVGTDILGFRDGKIYEYWAINSAGGWHH